MAPASSPSVPPLVLVVGGTGFQGGGCLEALLSTRRYRLRTITRNPKAPAALRLVKQGVEVVEGDLTDKASVDRAFDGVDYVFASTMSEYDGTEPQQGRNLGEGAMKAGVKLFVWSGGERIGTPSMDNKANMEDYFRSLPLNRAVYLHSSFFFENVATKRGTKRVKVNKERTHYNFSIPLQPDQQIPFISATDIGRFAAFVIDSPADRFKHGQVVPIAGDVVSAQQYVQAFARLTGKQATYQQLSLDYFRKLPIPGAHLIVEMYQWYQDGMPGEGHTRDPVAVRSMCPSVRNLDEWLQTTGIGLIEEFAYTPGWKTYLLDLLLWGYASLYGVYLRTRRLLLEN